MSLKDKIFAALRANELGTASPYQLSFAGTGESGASFGVMQNDTHTNSQARHLLLQLLPHSSDIVQLLSAPCSHNPLTPAQTSLVNEALASAGGRQLVDDLDQRTFSIVLAQLAKCVQAAEHIDDEAQIYIALWINMTGPPTTLLNFVKDQVITSQAIQEYLKSQHYFQEYPTRFHHLQQSVIH